MNVLVIGLGSMGKRRVRCLQSLGYKDIYGFDLREDRRDEVKERYGVQTFSEIEKAVEEVKPDAFIISVPPDVHHIYMKLAIQKQIHFFVEASVVDTDMVEIIEKADDLPIIAAPSATLMFHPAIRQISEIITSGQLGRISNILFHSGQYLPDWHTYEKVSDFYVSNPATGGAREIVPFELVWITGIFGFPQKVGATVRKTIDIEGAEKIDDTYNILLDYESFQSTITIDVVSRFATRRLVINGSDKQLLWDWNQNQIQVFNPALGDWEIIPYEMKSSAEGYNQNIGENMYIDELKDFFLAIQGKKSFIATLRDDHKILKLLYTIEQSSKTASFVEFTA